MEYKFILGDSFELKNSSKNNIEFVFSFQTARSLNRGWSDSVQKTIHQEYYIMDGITFVGITGGTMGLFVGLSFIDINSGILDLLAMLITYMLKNSKKNQF